MGRTGGDGDDEPSADRRQKVQSVEVGMALLKSLSRLGPAVPLSRLAQAAAMPPSKAHRYLRALIESGLAAQDEISGLYRLGPEALAIGFAAMQDLDVIRLSALPLAQLRDRTGETCILGVWSNRGPAVVRIEPAPGAVVLNVRMGSILPVLVSATGLAFAAFHDDSQVEELVEAERKQLRRAGKNDLLAQAERELVNARDRGLASVHSTLTPGVSALAAPIFDHQGQVVGVFAALGPTGRFCEDVDGPIARELRLAAAQTSSHLGCTEYPVSG